jgi:hypothetical protein
MSSNVSASRGVPVSPGPRGGGFTPSPYGRPEGTWRLVGQGKKLETACRGAFEQGSSAPLPGERRTRTIRGPLEGRTAGQRPTDHKAKKVSPGSGRHDRCRCAAILTRTSGEQRSERMPLARWVPAECQILRRPGLAPRRHRAAVGNAGSTNPMAAYRRESHRHLRQRRRSAHVARPGAETVCATDPGTQAAVRLRATAAARQFGSSHSAIIIATVGGAGVPDAQRLRARSQRGEKGIQPRA